MNTKAKKGQEEMIMESWQQSLPREWTIRTTDPDGQERDVPLRDHPVLAKYPTKDDAVKALVHAQRLIGRRPEGMVETLAADAAPEEREAFFAAIGRPENADGYELPDLELPERFELDEDLRTQFRHKAHELGLTMDQVRGLYEWFLPLNFQAFRELEDMDSRTREEEMETIRQVYRGETPGVLESAQKAALALGGEELLQALNETGAGNRAAVINAFARLAPTLLEGSLKGSSAPAAALSLERLREMMQDPRYHDPLQRDESFVKQVQDGFDRLYPGEYVPGSRL